jgi:hypothetical protein
MQLLANKKFGNLEIEVFTNDSTSFYMSRKQINDALEYKDNKSLHRVISRNVDVIGEGTTSTITQTEGSNVVTRIVELFDFKQIFQILRFSKSPKANLFMEFTALTMEQLLSGKAELEFKKEEDKESYLQEIKNVVSQARIYGFSKQKASLLVQEAFMQNIDPNIVILQELKDMNDLTMNKKKGRINLRVQYIATEYLKDNYIEAWKLLTDELKFDIGVSMRSIKSMSETTRKKAKDRGVKPLPKVPTYLDLIEEHDAFDEAERAIKRIIKRLEKENK